MKSNTRRELVLQRLKQHLSRLKEKYGIQRIALYGSFARNAQTGKSDVDLLVELSRPLGFEFVELADDLEHVLRRKVDLATFETYRLSKQDPRRRAIAENIEKDLVYVQ
ncbi:MAG: nucleotidyltransferase family protein [Elusimicrobia bacterium]|nr:nucleotidyltransferase family protein [Elusimicrobiota bacterium]